MRYGFVGLGNLGARMAMNLLRAGFEVTVSDLDAARGTALTAAGARWAESPRATASGIDGLITCLPSPAASRAVVLGEAGAFSGLAPGATWIEMSTIDAGDIQTLAAAAAEGGIETLECPVTGGVQRAARGEMTMLVGGDAPVLERHRPALEALVAKIIPMGPLGSASTIKVITNMLCAIDLVAAGEALMLAKRSGLDLKKSYEAICASSGNSVEFEDWAPVILNGSYNTGFTLDLGLKDLGFVTAMARDKEVPLQLTRLVERLYLEARDKYGGAAWTPHVVKMLEEATGETLRAEGFPDVIEAD